MQQDALVVGGRRRCAMTFYDPAWHQGVIGILASRIRGRVHRPTLVFADAEGAC